MSFRSTCPTCDLVSAFPEHRLSQPHHCQRCGEFRFLCDDGSAPARASTVAATSAGATLGRNPAMLRSDGAQMVIAFTLVGMGAAVVGPLGLLVHFRSRHQDQAAELAGSLLVWGLLAAAFAGPIVLAAAGRLGTPGRWLLVAAFGLVAGLLSLGLLAAFMVLAVPGSGTEGAHALGELSAVLAMLVSLPLLALGCGSLLAAACAPSPR